MAKQPPEGFVYIATYERKKVPSKKKQIKESVKIGITACEEKEIHKRVTALDGKYGANAKKHLLKYSYYSKYCKSIEMYVHACFFDDIDDEAISKRKAKSREHFTVSPKRAREKLKKAIGKIEDGRRGGIIVFHS